MNKKGPFQQLESKLIYSNNWISLREDTVLRPDGKEGVFGIVQMKAGSSVVAITDDNEIYLTKEYKYGIERESVELMSGGIENDETPLIAAQRELREEMGLIAKEWIDLGFVDPFTTVVQSPNHLFLAKDIHEVEWTPDKSEPLNIIKVPLSEAIHMVMESKITHSASCVLILKAARYLKYQ